MLARFFVVFRYRATRRGYRRSFFTQDTVFFFFVIPKVGHDNDTKFVRNLLSFPPDGGRGKS